MTPASLTRQLLPFSLAAFLGFLAIGIALPVLPLFTRQTLGYGTIVVGLVVGAQSLATLLSRPIAGRLCDRRGPKRTTLLGLTAAMMAGCCYLAAIGLTAHPLGGLCLLMLGRLALGFGESLFITALAAWSVARVGPAHAGRAMAWSGIAMYGAIAIGAPIGTLINDQANFVAVTAGVLFFPALAAGLTLLLRDQPVEARPPASLTAVIGRIWLPGLGMALASSGVGTIAAFLTLLYQTAGWDNAGLALTGFGTAYIVMRLFFAGVPDRVGGYPTAMASLAVEALGLMIVWAADSPLTAVIGASVTGLGYSLIFPSLGVEALRRVTPDHRGMALGAYLACFDLGIAGAGPIAGTIANLAGLRAVFPGAACAALLGLGLAGWGFRRVRGGEGGERQGGVS